MWRDNPRLFLRRTDYLLRIHLNEIVADNGGTVGVIWGSGGGSCGGGTRRGLNLWRRISRG